MKRKIFIVILITAVISIMLGIWIGFSYADNRQIDKEWAGTYEISVDEKDTGNITYLSILTDSTYILFNTNKEVLAEGNFKGEKDSAFLTLYENDMVLAELLCLQEEYYYIEGQQEPAKVIKTAEEPIVLS